MKSDSPAASPLRALLFRTEAALIAAVIAVVAITAVLDRNHSYLRPDDIDDIAWVIARNTSLLGMFALGAAVVIIAGGIDLSSGSMIAFSGMICSSTMLILAPAAMREDQPVGWPVVLAGFLFSIVAGLAVGTLHAWLITAVRLPPFIATLATLVGLRSFSRATIEYVTQTFGVGKNSQIFINDPIFDYIRDHVWVSVTVFLLLAAITWLVLSRTVLGRHLYALGGNEQAARLSGIRTENVKWAAYCFASVTAAIAGFFYIANESLAAPVNQGRGQELNAIASCVVGGCSLQGGIGTVPGVVLGALFLQIVIDAVSKVIKTGADVYEGLIVGVVVVIAVTFSQVAQLRAGRGLFQGALGWCVIPILSVFAGTIFLTTLGRNSGAAAAVVALVALGSLKMLELKPASGGR